MAKHDYQQKNVYEWQTTLPSGGQIDLMQAQAIVNHVWAAEGLKYPPTVEPIHSNMRKYAGTGDRLTIKLQPKVSMRTILHEIAHSMTTEFDRSEEITPHGPWFVGIFTRLLEKYLGVPMPVMLYTCSKHKVDINVMAYPLILD